jgi:hypothetical protein
VPVYGPLLDGDAAAPKSIEHLFIGCSYSRLVWFRVLHPFGWHHLTPWAPSPFAEWYPRDVVMCSTH